MSNHILINIINNIDKIDNIDIYNNRICNIFNKCSEEIQVDFIKIMFIKSKINETTFNSLKISNIDTIRRLLNWGCVNNNLQLCKFVLNHKDCRLKTNYYYKLEKLVRGTNQDIVYLLNSYRIKDTYETDNNDSDDSNNSDDSDTFSSNDDTSDFLDSSDNDLSSTDDEDSNNNIKYGKDIDPNDVIDVD